MQVFLYLLQVEDAQAAMRLYTMHKIQWEKELKLKYKQKLVKPVVKMNTEIWGIRREKWSVSTAGKVEWCLYVVSQHLTKILAFFSLLCFDSCNVE